MSAQAGDLPQPDKTPFGVGSLPVDKEADAMHVQHPGGVVLRPGWAQQKVKRQYGELGRLCVDAIAGGLICSNLTSQTGTALMNSGRTIRKSGSA